jgi:hypothetical protein
MNKLKKLCFIGIGLVFFSISPIIQAATVVYVDQSMFASAVDNIKVANFDIEGDGTPITAGTIIDQQYALIGMDFNSFAAGQLTTATEPSPPVISPLSVPNFMNVSPNGATGTGMGGFEVVFDDAVFGIGMYFGGLHPIDNFGATVLNIRDSAESSIASFIVQDEVGESPLDYLFFGVTSTTLIGSFNVTIGTGIGDGTEENPFGDYVWFEDVQYGNSRIPAVPVPAAVWLFGTALIGFIGVSRRRKVT